MSIISDAAGAVRAAGYAATRATLNAGNAAIRGGDKATERYFPRTRRATRTYMEDAPRVNAVSQPLLSTGQKAIISHERNIANGVLMLMACVAYFVVFLAILLTRNWDPASLPVSFTVAVTTANFSTANGVDSGGNGMSPVKVVGEMWAQGVAFPIAGAFTAVCIYAVAACASFSETAGWVLYPFRWIPTYNYNTKVIPDILVMTMLATVQIPTQIATGFRVFDVFFYVPCVCFALAVIRHEASKYLDTEMRKGDLVKTCVTEVAKMHIEIYKEKSNEKETYNPEQDAGLVYKNYYRALNPVLSSTEISITWYAFANSVIVALSLVPMQIRYNAMPVKPQWVSAGVVIVWLWMLIFTGIPYMSYMLAVFNLARWQAVSSDKDPWMSPSQMLRVGHFVACIVHMIYPLLFLAVFVGLYARDVMSAQNPPNVYKLTYNAA